MALLLAWPPSRLPAQALRIRFLDVGQGDAALIRTAEGKSVLIDAGPRGSAVSEQLTALGVDTIDLVVASHNHADHIGGMTEVLARHVVRFYLDNGMPATTRTYLQTIEAVRAGGIQYLIATSRTITVGSAQLRVLTPPTALPDQNNNSVGLLLTHGSFAALFTGDSEFAELAHWLANDSVPEVTVLKAAHHGSWNGASSAWVRRTSPEVVVVSVGAGNTYHHPSAATLTRWNAVGARIFRTDQDGSIEILADSTGGVAVTTGRHTE